MDLRLTPGSVAHLVDAIEHLPEALVVWDPDDALVTCNRLYTRLFPEPSFVRPGIRFGQLVELNIDTANVRSFAMVVDVAGEPAAYRCGRRRGHLHRHHRRRSDRPARAPRSSTEGDPPLRSGRVAKSCDRGANGAGRTNRQESRVSFDPTIRRAESGPPDIAHALRGRKVLSTFAINSSSLVAWVAVASCHARAGVDSAAANHHRGQSSQAVMARGL